MNKDGFPINITGNTITSAANNTFGIRVTSSEAPPPGVVRIDDQIINLTGTAAVGIDLNALGVDFSGPGDLTLTSLQGNTVTTPLGTVFQSTASNATIFGEMLINDITYP